MNNWFKLFLLTIFFSNSTNAFTDYLLKKCNQAGFCQRNRYYANNIQSSHNSYYHIDEQSIHINSNDFSLGANIIKTIPRDDIDDITIILPFKLSFQNDWQSVRFTIDESIDGRKVSELPLLNHYRYNETGLWSFMNHTDSLNNTPLLFEKLENIQSNLNKLINFVFQTPDLQNNVIKIYNQINQLEIHLFLDSFQIHIFQGNDLILSINDRSLFNFEHHRSLEENFQNVLPEESTFNMFADDFEYSKNDQIPFGPESIALDFTFNEFNSLFGIPEHADSLRLKDTSNDEPYRLFNVDVFQYNLDSKMPMYGAIPLLLTANKEKSVGVFWNNPSDTWVDIHYTDNNKISQSHIMSESGIIDVFVFIGKKPSDISDQFTQLTGRPVLPLLSSIGYHQCRWNYNDELDVLNVQENMDREDIPFDFIWLDLEYTDDKKYFTWKPDSFKNPGKMLKKLAKYGRQLAILIDPHLKTEYHVSEEVEKENAGVLNANGDLYVGRCWPGDSIWIDTMGKIGQRIWEGLFKVFVTVKLPFYIDNLHIWNDMNEPSIFNGPETTAPKDLIHNDGFEERSIHNVYGLTVHETTYNSMKDIYATSDKRPFILTRAFFAGSQRSAATWTGDNIANWDYLTSSIPMVLSNNIVGMPFIGADIAGFDGNPTPELIVRWYQAGLWYPFFRAHAHIDSIRREPYLLDKPVRDNVRDSIRLRYSLLPTFYSAFHEASVNGNAIMKPMFFQYPEYEELYNIDNQFYLGDYGILVKPITSPETFTTQMTFPRGIFYDLLTFRALVVDQLKEIEIDAPITKIPAFIEGGHILFKRDIYRRSSKLMENDPYTLVIAPSLENGSASGKLYVDDGETFSYESGEYLETVVSLVGYSILKNDVIHSPENVDCLGNTMIEKIVVAVDKNNMDIGDHVTIKVGSETRKLNIEHVEGATTVEIKSPQVHVYEQWEITF
ncbi:similar to Saccharomyces cerevisiae YBR229C ROT2 Glucosidase II catalytic subunit required for normal cell wall synthesis [Maudiozyma saulgeensis]|uniref:Glucosidase II subunit alpha n=1 Tax=Maudiozyma saulgeensis TaxID=1789683 RepID=A0A1X7R0Y2_9SACH|nr:similar to Saccharomyces cerevisiae YBR229C ROT2 Glucosidase II catalytic subunit required for normal cell wall synthesis [Kazachstania saulgeensis]